MYFSEPARIWNLIGDIFLLWAVSRRIWENSAVYSLSLRPRPRDVILFCRAMALEATRSCGDFSSFRFEKLSIVLTLLSCIIHRNQASGASCIAWRMAYASNVIARRTITELAIIVSVRLSRNRYLRHVDIDSWPS